MSKIIRICIVLLMVFGLAVIASAKGDMDWSIRLRASTDSSAKMNAFSYATYGLTTDPALAGVYEYAPPSDISLLEIDCTNSALGPDARVQSARHYNVDPSLTSTTWAFTVTGPVTNLYYVSAVNPTGISDIDNVNAGFTLTIYEIINSQRSNPYVFDFTKNGSISNTTGLSSGWIGFQRLYSSPMSFEMIATPVPEPSSMFVMLSGIIGLLGIGFRRKK